MVLAPVKSLKFLHSGDEEEEAVDVDDHRAAGAALWRAALVTWRLSVENMVVRGQRGTGSNDHACRHHWHNGDRPHSGPETFESGVCTC